MNYFPHGSIQLQVINSDGGIAHAVSWNNLIVAPQVLNDYAFPDLFTRCYLGQGNTAPFVGQVALVDPLPVWSNAYLAGATNNNTTAVSPNIVEFVRTFEFVTGTLNGTYSEIGFSNGANPLFSRSLIRDVYNNLAPITVSPTQSVVIHYVLQVTVLPLAPKRFLANVANLTTSVSGGSTQVSVSGSTATLNGGSFTFTSTDVGKAILHSANITVSSAAPIGATVLSCLPTLVLYPVGATLGHLGGNVVVAEIVLSGATSITCQPLTVGIAANTPLLANGFTFAPIITAVTSPTTATLDTSYFYNGTTFWLLGGTGGVYQLQNLPTSAFSGISNTGAVINAANSGLDTPQGLTNTVKAFISTDSSALGPAGATTPRSSGTNIMATFPLVSTTPSRYKELVITIPLGSIVTVRSFGLGDFTNPWFTYLLDGPIIKPANAALTLTIRLHY
jgi:hypothetical protein